MSTIKRKIRYILSADVFSFNINTKSLIYKEIYKYVFLKIYRQAYFSTLLNMHLLLYIDTHTHSPEGSLCAHLLPASLYVLFYFGKGMAFQFICSLSILLQIHSTIVLHQHTQLASVCHLCRFNCWPNGCHREVCFKKLMNKADSIKRKIQRIACLWPSCFVLFYHSVLMGFLAN